MPVITIVAGVILELVGFGGWVMTGQESWTALIPAIFGTLLILLGVFSLSQPGLRKHLMHGAAVLGLLGFLGTVKGLFSLPALIAGGEAARPAAVVSQSITAVVCFLFLAFCINSFIRARRAAASAN